MKPGMGVLPFVTAAALSLSTTSGFAYEAGDWIVKAGTATVSPDESSSHLTLDGEVLSLGGGTSTVKVDDNTQLGLTATYMLTDNWGVELIAATPFTHTVSGAGELSGLDIAEIDHLPPILSAVYHFESVEGFTPYVGVGLNYTLFFNEDLTSAAETALADLGLTGGDMELDDSVGLSLQVGLDYQLNETWFVNASVRWADIETTADIEFDNGSAIETDVVVDPLVYSILVGRRF